MKRKPGLTWDEHRERVGELQRMSECLSALYNAYAKTSFVGRKIRIARDELG